MHDQRRTPQRLAPGTAEVRVQPRDHTAVLERGAVAGLEIGFRRQTLRAQHAVLRQFHVEPGHRRRGDLCDAAAVDQILHRDQHIVDEHRVIRRQIQVTGRQSRAERARRHPHRPHRARIGVARAIDPAAADPDHRRGRAIVRHNEIAAGQSLHRDVPVRRRDPRALGEALHRHGRRVGDAVGDHVQTRERQAGDVQRGAAGGAAHDQFVLEVIRRGLRVTAHDDGIARPEVADRVGENADARRVLQHQFGRRAEIERRLGVFVVAEFERAGVEHDRAREIIVHRRQVHGARSFDRDPAGAGVRPGTADATLIRDLVHHLQRLAGRRLQHEIAVGVEALHEDAGAPAGAVSGVLAAGAANRAALADQAAVHDQRTALLHEDIAAGPQPAAASAAGGRAGGAAVAGAKPAVPRRAGGPIRRGGIGRRTAVLRRSGGAAHAGAPGTPAAAAPAAGAAEPAGAALPTWSFRAAAAGAHAAIAAAATAAAEPAIASVAAVAAFAAGAAHAGAVVGQVVFDPAAWPGAAAGTATGESATRTAVAAIAARAAGNALRTAFGFADHRVDRMTAHAAGTAEPAIAANRAGRSGAAIAGIAAGPAGTPWSGHARGLPRPTGAAIAAAAAWLWDAERRQRTVGSVAAVGAIAARGRRHDQRVVAARGTPRAGFSGCGGGRCR